ncbi:MAG: hypothetical protein AB8B56_12080 [Crocinitomicaceae bacterium]
MKIQLFILFGSMLVIGPLFAQNKKTAEFNADAWQVDAKNHSFTDYKGKQALFLDQGKARLKNSSFKNGVIEYDINFKQERSFAGVHFHIQNELNYEEYYLRAHQSGNEDAMQYTSVTNGNAAWQLYSGKGHWSPITFRFGEWMHVKLIVSGTKMDVFIDDMEKPILHVSELKLGSTSGGLGFGTFLGSAYYANLTYEEIQEPKFVTKATEPIPLESGTILDWKVSEAFPDTRLTDVNSLAALNIPIKKSLKTDANGILNLSHISKVTDETNTILAKLEIDSSADQMKKIEFGYSDKVTVFVNGKPIYYGDNSFRSRYYRYLGSIGYFDTVYLYLKKGKNEIVFAVTEKMGGWGITAKLIK